MKADNIITETGQIIAGKFEFDTKTNKWKVFNPINTKSQYDGSPLFSMLPAIDIHFHGISNIDFSNLNAFDLKKADDELNDEGILGVPTIYVPRNEFKELELLLQKYLKLKNQGQLKNIAGFALEGPVLSSIGGTPTEAAWIPTIEEWKNLISSCSDALVYVVLSPDISLAELELPDNYLCQLIELLDSYGIYSALGHFLKAYPQSSAKKVDEAVEIIARNKNGKTRTAITDHLLNDMPVNIKYSWRTEKERNRKNNHVLEKELNQLNLSNMKNYLGDVPYSIIEKAILGKAIAFINADGDHVDKLIVKHLINIIQPANMVIMTDRSKSFVLAKRALDRGSENTLLYQSEGVVACGTQGLEQQVNNLINIGINSYDILQMISINPFKLLENSCCSIEAKLLSIDNPVSPGVFIKDNKFEFIFR